MIKLSERLKCVADMVSPGGGAADIGTDHAYIPIYLLQKGIKDHLLACDVGKGPLAMARANIRKYGLEGQVETCLSDGLDKVDLRPGDSVIIAGMGGLLIRDILRRGEDKARAAGELILQPQSEIPELRRYLASTGFAIRDEDAIKEDGKFYFIIKAAFDERTELTECQAEFGPVLLQKKHPILKEYLRKCLEVEKGILDHLSGEKPADNVRKRMKQVVGRITLIEKTMGDYYEMQ